MATAPTYCTHRQLKDVFPQVDSFDSKRPLFTFTEQDSSKTFTNSVDIYQHSNSGLVTALYRDGNDLDSGKQTIGTSAATAINNGSGYNTTATSMVVDSGSSLTDDTYIKIGDEILLITGISTNTLTVERAKFGTTAASIDDDASVYKHFQPSVDGGWLYDSDNDFVVMSVTDTTNPSDNLMEAGEDFSTLITRITANASRYLDSRLDPNLPQNQLKDKEGNYDYIIIRTTALIASSFLVRSHDPNSDIANKFMEEVDTNIELLNTGKAALSWQNTGDSSKGVIRDVIYTDGSVRPVDTRGRWTGSWDLIKVSISSTTAGAIGTAKYNVYVKDEDGLKNNQVVTEEIITGDYQPLAGGLQIRFGASNVTAASGISASVATANNEWEIEVAGYNEEVDLNNSGSKKMTRGGLGIYGRNNY